MTAIEQRRYRAKDPSTWATFVDYYMRDFSAANAYMRTYGAHIERARQRGPQLIRSNGWIRAEITRRSEGRITLSDITPERVTLEIARLAFFDPRKTVRTEVAEDGATLKEVPIPLAMLDEDTARGVTGISYDVRGNRVLKSEKTSALAALAKMLIYPDLKTNEARAGSTNHSTSDEEEIALILADNEALEEDPSDVIDAGDEIEGEYASDDDE